MSQQWLKSSRPSKQLLGTCAQSVSLALADGTNSGCLGVPFLHCHGRHRKMRSRVQVSQFQLAMQAPNVRAIVQRAWCCTMRPR